MLILPRNVEGPETVLIRNLKNSRNEYRYSCVSRAQLGRKAAMKACSPGRDVGFYCLG